MDNFRLELKMLKSKIEVFNFLDVQDLLCFVNELERFNDSIWLFCFNDEMLVTGCVDTISVIISEFEKYGFCEFTIYEHRSFVGAYEHCTQILENA